MADDDLDDPSTLVRSGKLALTYSEMTAFVEDIEARPLARLTEDLPKLMALSDAKHQLVVMVLKKKTRPDSPERTALLTRLGELQAHTPDQTVRERAREFLAKASS